MKKAKKSNPFKKFVICAIILCLVLTGSFFATVYINADKMIYAVLMENYSDSFEESYIEKPENFAKIVTHEINFLNSLLPYQTVSVAVDQKIEYLSPFLLYVLARPSQAKEAKKISAQLGKAKADFSEAINALNTKVINYEINPSENRLNDINLFYYTIYLPRYLNYITEKQNLSLFAEKVLTENNIISSPIKNVVNVQNLLIDCGITFVLPSIIVGEQTNFEFEQILCAEDSISLKFISREFDLVKTTNKFQINSELTSRFENTLYSAQEAYKSAKNIFESLSFERKNTYLKSSKIKPSSLPATSSANFNYAFMETVLAKTTGSLITILNNGAIENYFGDGND